MVRFPVPDLIILTTTMDCDFFCAFTAHLAPTSTTSINKIPGRESDRLDSSRLQLVCLPFPDVGVRIIWNNCLTGRAWTT
jgi:hypothetical protein